MDTAAVTDLSTIPDSALYREINRRRARTAGRKRKPTPCKRCGALCASARLARAHCAEVKRDLIGRIYRASSSMGPFGFTPESLAAEAARLGLRHVQDGNRHMISSDTRAVIFSMRQFSGQWRVLEAMLALPEPG